MTEPTDVEILELASQYWHCLDETESATEIELVRAALAKWGQPAPDEIINMAREQGLPETETEGVFIVNADDLGRIFASYRAARAPAERLPVNWMAEVERVICRMNSSDPDFDDCADAVALIIRLTAEVTGPKGYATWKDAAVAERIRANSVLEDAARYRWLREGNDAKHGAAWHVAVNLYGCEWDAAIDAARKQGESHGR